MGEVVVSWVVCRVSDMNDRAGQGRAGQGRGGKGVGDKNGSSEHGMDVCPE
jgi:hypothetical protein